MKTVLITGAYGQLGVACTNYLKLNFNVISSGRQAEGMGIKLDITDCDSIEHAQNEFHPDIILNLAAMTNVDGCEIDSQLAKSVNVDGVKNLCNGFCGHFIQISTDYVFDGLSGPYGEADEVNPLSVYGRTKLEAEDWLSANHSQTTILRSNVVYGYTERTDASFVKWVIDSLSNKKGIAVVDDQWNNPTWIESLTDIIGRLMKEEVTGLYHYGGYDYMNRFEFAQLIANVFDLDISLISPISTRDLNQLANRPLKSGLKTEKIQSALGIIPNSVETCLQEIRKQLSE